MNAEQSLEILLSKNCRNDAARLDGEEEDGSEGGMLRERRELRVDHSLQGCLELVEIIER